MRATAAAVLLLAVLGAVPPAGHGEDAPVVDGPDPRYRRLDDVLARLESLEREHPDLARRVTIGRSRQGEAIVALVVGGRRDGPDPRPVVLLHAAQHANEPAGTGALVLLVERLLARHGEDPALTALVDDVVTWVVPVVNPDGHRRVFSGADGWRAWRKNGREPHGVDLNRNWDHRWAEDPSTRPASRNYKGPRPFSEPEAVALRDLVLRERPVLVLDLHSPGKITPGNVVFWPWLVRQTGETGPDAAAYRDVARAFAARTETAEDGVFLREAPGYDTLPKEQNWIYRETGTCVLLAEIGLRFFEEGPVVERIAERTATGCLALLERARNGPGLLLVARDRATGAPVVAEGTLAGAEDPAVGPRRTDPRSGSARRLLQPGPVAVTVRAEGYASEMRRIEIAEVGWTRLEVDLEGR